MNSEYISFNKIGTKFDRSRPSLFRRSRNQIDRLIPIDETGDEIDRECVSWLSVLWTKGFRHRNTQVDETKRMLLILTIHRFKEEF